MSNEILDNMLGAAMFFIVVFGLFGIAEVAIWVLDRVF